MIRLLGYREVEAVIFESLRSNEHNNMTRAIEQQVSAQIIQKVMDGCYTPIENTLNTIQNAIDAYESKMYAGREELFE